MSVIDISVVFAISLLAQCLAMSSNQTAGVQEHIETLVNKLIHRARNPWRPHHVDLDDAMLAKAPHVNVPLPSKFPIPIASSISDGGRLSNRVQSMRTLANSLNLTALRRRAFLEAAVATASMQTLRANADTDYNVRLQDVENPKTRAAVEAADRGDFKLAEELFSQVVQDEPNSASAYSNLGNAQMSLGKYKEAKSRLTKAVELAPGAPVPRLNRAIALDQLGEFEAAVEDCTYAISLDPNEFAAWHNRGQIQADMGKWDQAAEDFQKGADLAPGIAGYRLKEALARWQIGDIKTARRQLSGLTRKYSNYAEARAALAALLYSVGEEKTAEDQFATALSLDSRMVSPTSYAKERKWPPVVSDALRKFKACAGRRDCVLTDGDTIS